MALRKDPRASWKPSATSLGAGGGTGVLAAIWALVIINTDISEANAAFGGIVVAALGAGLSAFLTPDDDVSLGRRARKAALAFMSQEDPIKIDPGNNTDGFGGEPPRGS